MNKLFAVVWLAMVIPAHAAANSSPHTYSNDFKTALKIADDLYQTLDAKFQKGINPVSVRMETMPSPVITPVPGNQGNNGMSQVFISDGYIDLINHLAHAKAIDHVQHGYFDQYVLNLARENAGDSVPDLPNMVDPRFWTDDVMNDQITFFNQMLSLTLGINLAHHYLGHYSKYSSQMLAGKLVPINNLLGPAEWEASVKAGTLNSLNCALGVDGVKALFDAIDKMPKRPSWTNFIAPPTADLKKLNKQLSKYETDYFHGALK